MNATYKDLLIEDGDIVLDVGRNPITCINDQCIAQDVKHAILESRLAVELVAERSMTTISDIEHQLIMLAENDLRIIPGTGAINIVDDERLLTASTYEFGDIDAWI
ncbi:DUF2590 family protein [Aliivibrio sp. S2TY2]|uniref:DUF2590 family protein n=1 Tax=unclassified Aliivibrio TaxID=2645654 RepID=UPI00237A01BC|nr:MULTISPECIES: DUF2590 family protein [unclassified Aliivibrio]MDD9174503.1 DUF2590 family protein [Aliivibrio sp. S3TY1]MDD9191581.1 DUF2590 family protein [Aliivibrio sp. S2TY2]